MEWLFSEMNRNTKRVFVSFIECEVIGTWKLNRIIVEGESHKVYEALNRDNCEVNLVMSNGRKRHLKFTTGGIISIEQSMLLFLPDNVTEDKTTV